MTPAADRAHLSRALSAVAGRARPIGAIAVVAAVVGGVILRRTGVDLGAATAPLFWVNFHDKYRFGPAHPWWPAPVLAATLAAAIVLLRARRLPSPLFLVGAFAVALGARLGLNTAQFGRDEWTWPLTRPNSVETEYPAAYHLVAGQVGAFVDHFAELVPHLPIHPSGHPVGATLAFYALDQATGSPAGTAFVLSALGALAVVPTFLLGRSLGDEMSARLAVVLFALAPQTLLYGATSYDGAFVPVTTLAVWLLVTRPAVWGALVLAGAFLLSYALAIVGLFAALVVGRRQGVRIVVATVVTTLAVLAVLALVFGYDPIRAVLATRDAYERGIGGRRPYGYWVIGGPAAFLIVLGPLLAERLLQGVERGGAAARALAICVLVAAASGVMEAEVERIWQFLVPLAAVAAAPYATARRWVWLGLAAGLLQAYAIELHWDTTF